MKKYLLIGLIAVFVAGCKDEPVTPQNVDFSGIKYNSTGNLNITLTHKFNEALLERNKEYITEAKDTIMIDQLRYYFTNVQLRNDAGVWINLNNYNLVDIENPPSLNIDITNVPAGIYDKVRFYVGVDSIANSSGTQEGALSPANDMFWSWNTGYIFLRIKGKFNGDKPLALDIGGTANLAVVDLDLISFKKEGNNAKLNVAFNLADVFITPTVYDLKTMESSIHSVTSPGAKVLKDNIQTGVFSITSVQ